ncbi:hypothetical protein [Embleya sp. NPDC059259]|uniref:hypothetical protein n=1 Tax=unclassified Embleya TaxID=2699296 RepID=UPI0036BE3A17
MSGMSVRLHDAWRLRFVIGCGSRERTVTAGQAIASIRAFYLGWPRHLHLVPAVRRPGRSGALLQLWQQGSERRLPWRDFDPGVRLAPGVPPHRPSPVGRDWFEDKPTGTPDTSGAAPIPFTTPKR